ncbi:hypothetical protein M9Y10_018773 [Tritrichomonas musculus]|uniref:Uncharacterized protein n=1 Tax=Tritrichomonas musculus TaxID=1915356 RepID=A0ABR2HHP2_9EUKA
MNVSSLNKREAMSGCQNVISVAIVRVFIEEQNHYQNEDRNEQDDQINNHRWQSFKKSKSRISGGFDKLAVALFCYIRFIARSKRLEELNRSLSYHNNVRNDRNDQKSRYQNDDCVKVHVANVGLLMRQVFVDFIDVDKKLVKKSD